ncbi:MAG: SprT family zinc-dependent metalloprotease [Clostridia bacterium]
MQLVVGDITVTVLYKRVKNMRITIKSNQNMVILTMPNNYKIEKGITFINQKSDWIHKNLDKKLIYTLPTNFEMNQSIYIFGNKYPIIRKETDKLSIRFDKISVIINCPKSTLDTQIVTLINKFYKQLVTIEVNNRLAKWENKLNLYSNNWYVRTMTSKWGSCNIKTKRLCFNSLLAKFPIECLDYLIIHELAHLKYPYHDKDFYNFVAKFCPNYKLLRKTLKY